ncbi:MAG: hypothetical protein IJL18_02315 [Synergistaceae bacterium]|nr:hypothetical protein [Synergistaceae bacterium]
MFDIRNTTEYQTMINELKASGVWAKVDGLTFYNVHGYLSDAQLQEVLKEVPEEDRDQFITQNRLLRDDLVKYYSNGGILTLFHPDDAQIRQTVSFLESVSADVALLDISEDVEICAITKQTSNGPTVSGDNIQLDNVFVYVIPNVKTFVAVESEDSPYDVEKEYLDMQVERWRRYYLWLASIKDRVQENANTASSIREATTSSKYRGFSPRLMTGLTAIQKRGTDSLQKAVILTYPPMTHT